LIPWDGGRGREKVISQRKTSGGRSGECVEFARNLPRRFWARMWDFCGDPQEDAFTIAPIHIDAAVPDSDKPDT